MKHEHELGCEDIIKSLNAYVDGELDGAVCSEIEAHLNACSNCRIVVNTLKKTIEICQKDGRKTRLPADVRSRLYHALNLDNHANTD
ncbi:MAG: zf-HC2 domain-containing protein [Bacteroides sp.]|jgi:anti-sigma factor (TIGR02949 family)|nr:zf-HC2 domain-containing protein [Bacteroides sp.]